MHVHSNRWCCIKRKVYNIDIMQLPVQSRAWLTPTVAWGALFGGRLGLACCGAAGMTDGKGIAASATTTRQGQFTPLNCSPLPRFKGLYNSGERINSGEREAAPTRWSPV